MNPAPMSRSASRTLTAAMMPSSRFVVSRFPAVMSASSSVRRTRVAAEWGLRARGVELVHRADAVVGHFAELLDRRLETREFPAQVLDRRFQVVQHLFAAVGKEEVGGSGSNESPDHRASHHCS